MVRLEDNLIRRLPRATLAFFAIFSRLECALKRADYVRVRQNDAVEADWNKFAKELGRQFFEEVLAAGKANTLIEAPPKKQISSQGHLDWAPVAKVTNVHELFGAVCRVRNNLFHGGKFQAGPIEGTSRNEILLLQAKWVLEQAVQKRSQVWCYFDDRVT